MQTRGNRKIPCCVLQLWALPAGPWNSSESLGEGCKPKLTVVFIRTVACGSAGSAPGPRRLRAAEVDRGLPQRAALMQQRLQGTYPCLATQKSISLGMYVANTPGVATAFPWKLPGVGMSPSPHWTLWSWHQLGVWVREQFVMQVSHPDFQWNKSQWIWGPINITCRVPGGAGVIWNSLPFSTQGRATKNMGDSGNGSSLWLWVSATVVFGIQYPQALPFPALLFPSLPFLGLLNSLRVSLNFPACPSRATLSFSLQFPCLLHCLMLLLRFYYLLFHWHQLQFLTLTLVLLLSL